MAQTVVFPRSHVAQASEAWLPFNVICVGQTGLGKSTLINTIFASHLHRLEGPCWDPIVKYIKDQHSAYLRKELTAQRERIYIVVLKKLSDVVNVVPYPYDNDELDEEERALNAQIKNIIPFAVVGSEKSIIVEGKQVRGRQNRWGFENEAHCEFVYLRNFLTRTHLQDLIETTSQIHYETFRAQAAAGPQGVERRRELSRGSQQRMTINGY
ncbi:Septin-domain-containing protein [Tricharina praecox]|uniref:Septin-domain-containing protein n=1 Tax=Tricharina praecox TaxID=43433 RepID=UPI00221F8EB2|nr:Septin-domain-containing protein [Tricharina praecox]KAI5841298.1 Septin-domain-containing protein [Tricharina praecox]